MSDEDASCFQEPSGRAKHGAAAEKALISVDKDRQGPLSYTQTQTPSLILGNQHLLRLSDMFKKLDTLRAHMMMCKEKELEKPNSIKKPLQDPSHPQHLE